MTTPSSQHILIVDDDPAIRELLRDCLEPEGFRVSEAAGSEAMHGILGQHAIDLITLDLMLGGENGLTIATQVRSRHDVPIVMITGKGDMVDKVVGLEMGADDYITKPFHPREVVARLRAVLRRKGPANGTQTASATERMAFGDWVIDLGKRQVVSSKQGELQLTTAEFNLLAIFTKRPQRVLSRDAIMDLLKGHDWTPFDRSIDALVSRVRRKLEDDSDSPQYLKTVRGVGYVLACDVKPL
jgi:DNA-binding response OmpR family regulator